MTKTSFADKAALMSPRTAKYVEAMIREGDSFDYNRWLKRVREEEAKAKWTDVGGTSGELVAVKIGKPMMLSTSDDQHAWPNPPLPLIPKTILAPRVLRQPYRQAKSQMTNARLRRWLERIRRACDDFQARRARDAVYEYLAAVFAIVMHYKVRRRTTRLLRHAFEFANLPLDKNTDPFSAVIRCTSERDIDNKTISKWARALRYVARSKEPRTRLKIFMKEVGGVNACAARYAELRRHRRSFP